MRNLFEFLLKRSAWIVFLIYVVLCFVLLFNNNPYQRSRYLSSSNALVSGLNSATTSVTGYFGLRTENVDLLYQNGRLQNEVIELSRELNALRLQLDGDSLRRIAAPAAPDFIMAQVIRNSSPYPQLHHDRQRACRRHLSRNGSRQSAGRCRDCQHGRRTRIRVDFGIESEIAP